MNSEIFNSSYLKVERAQEGLLEIQSMIESDPPYSYILETDLFTNQRATLARKNSRPLERLVIRCGELFHNLRSAIDQAYFEAIAPHLPEEKHKAIQFPVSKDLHSYEQTILSRHGEKAGPEFLNAIKSLKAYHGEEGNFYLVLLHELNVTDKHKFPAPTGNFSKINSATLQKIIPDFPGSLIDCEAGRCKKDVVWSSQLFNPKDIGDCLPPFLHIYQKVLNVPVETWFYIENPYYNGEIIGTLKSFIQKTHEALDVMRTAIESRPHGV